MASARTLTVRFYRDVDDQWRWQLIAGNGRRLCNPGEAFSGRNKAIANAAQVLGIEVSELAEEVADLGERGKPALGLYRTVAGSRALRVAVERP